MIGTLAVTHPLSQAREGCGRLSRIGALAATAIALATGAPRLDAQAAPPLRAVAADTLVVDAPPPDSADPRFAFSHLRLVGIERAREGLGLAEILTGTPGVQGHAQYNSTLGERLFVRGAGTRAGYGVRGMGIYLNGIPLTFPDGDTQLELIDNRLLSAITLFRGAAPLALHAPGEGALRLETIRAEGTELEGTSADAGLGRLFARHSMGRGPHRGTVSATRLRYGGGRDWSGVLGYNANASYHLQAGRNRILLQMGIAADSSRDPGALSAEELAIDRAQSIHLHGHDFQRVIQETTRHHGGLRWTHAGDRVQVEGVGYGLHSTAERPLTQIFVELDRAAAGGRLAASAPMGGVRGRVGARADRQWNDREHYLHADHFRRGDRLDQRETLDVAGAFAELVTALRTDLHTALGVRYDSYRLRAADRLALQGDLSGELRYGGPAVQLTAAFDGLEDVQLFGGVWTSLDPPTTSELADQVGNRGGLNPALDPQRSLNAQAGARGRAMGSVGYSVTAFHSRVRELLTPYRSATIPDLQLVRSAEAAVRQGVEVEAAIDLSGRIVPTRAPALAAMLSYTLVDARYTRYAPADSVFDGNRIPGFAPHSLTARLHAAEPGRWSGVLQLRAVSPLPANDANTVEAPGYAAADIRVARAPIVLGGTSIEPFVGMTNILHREYIGGIVPNALAGRYFIPAPRGVLLAGVRTLF